MCFLQGMKCSTQSVSSPFQSRRAATVFCLVSKCQTEKISYARWIFCSRTSEKSSLIASCVRRPYTRPSYIGPIECFRKFIVIRPLLIKYSSTLVFLWAIKGLRLVARKSTKDKGTQTKEIFIITLHYNMTPARNTIKICFTVFP